MPEGYITKGIGGFYYVKTQGRVLECKAKGIFRKRNITPVAGDKVTVAEEAGSWVIADILPRKNVFVRPPIANLDVLFIVASTTQPTPSTLVLDKLSAIAADKGAQPVLIITKSDLAGAEKLQKAYAPSPLPVIVADHATGEGLDDIRGWIEGRLCAFCGNSGVGKSTLLNALLPADTPGFASLDTGRACYIPKENLQYAFPEFEPYIPECRFTGCSHRAEAGCAVRAAVEAGEISPTRYESYLAMYDEVKDIKDWEVR